MRQQIRSAHGHSDSECVTQTARSRHPAGRRAGRTLSGAQQDRFGNAGRSGDNIGAGMHAVDKENIHVAALKIHRLHTRGAPPAP
jgi:hypothetical protein